jgi:D-xylose transport system substrate-binding protein
MNVRILLGTVAVAALALTGCSAADTPASDSDVVAFIMPDATTSTRWDSQDRPAFEAAMAEIDPDITVLASSASDDAGQLQQAEAALAKGAKVIVVNPITSDGAGALIAAAQREGAAVIAYDGLITGSPIDGYVSFGNQKVGELQAQYLVDNLEEGANIAFINGEQTCDSCISFKVGAHEVLDPYFEDGTFNLVYEVDTPGWLVANAQQETEQALTAAQDDIAGFMVANDGMAQGVIAALKARGLAGKVLVTGQDATIASLQEMLLGNQSMTVYKDMRLEAAAAAELAVALLRGEDLPTSTLVDNGAGDVPSILLDPSVVEKDGIPALVEDGFVSRDDICVESTLDACTF